MLPLLVAPTLLLGAQPLTFSTLAGYAGQRSADGSASNARFNSPGGVAADAAGNLYVADTGDHVIRKISPSGSVTTLAGLAGVSGTNDGSGGFARFNSPEGIAVDGAGTVYVADSANHTVRMITPGGNVNTLAGLAGASGSTNATGSAARFYEPEGIAVDAAANVYVADSWNDTIRVIAPGGAVTVLAGSPGVAGSLDAAGGAARFNQPQALALDSATNLYVADTGNQTIRKITPAGVVTTLAGAAGSFGSADGMGTNAQFFVPAGVAVDGAGNVYVADSFNQTIRQMSPAGMVTTLAGAAGKSGSGDGTGGSARFYIPQGVAVSGTGLYVADSGNGSIRLVSAGGATTTSAGSASIGSVDGAGSAVRFSAPAAIAADSFGNIYAADSANGTVRKSTASGEVSTLAGVAGSFGTNDGSGVSARFLTPQGLAADSAGNLYLADTGNHTIRKITPTGTVTTLAGAAGTNGVSDGSGAAARFNFPQALSLDSAGNIYVADTWNHTVRKVTPAGVVTTLAGLPGRYGDLDGGANTGTNAARFYCPSGIAVDASTNIYVADTRNHTIRIVSSAGTVSTLAGLPGVWGSADGSNSTALFFFPQGLLLDKAGNLYVADSGNHAIRKMSLIGTNWAVSTVGGSPGVNGSVGGVGTRAQFSFPAGLASDGGNVFYVADMANNELRLGLLITNGAPAITNQPQSQVASAGASAGFTVGATGANPLAYQWRSNGTNVPGATSASFARTNIQAGDAGSYSVFVSNLNGNVRSVDASLTVLGPPVIVTQPQSQSVSLGQSATFSVSASGTPPLTYQWRFDDAAIPGATGASFTLPSVQGTNIGSYSVVVTNTAGSVVSADAVLAIATVAAWGDDSWGQTSVPVSALDVIAVAAGAWHNLALSANGAVVAWGDDVNGQCDVPPGFVAALAIAAGGYHSLAISAGGTVLAWGDNDYGQTNVPPTLNRVIGISAGSFHSVALCADATVVAWGDNTYGQTNVPSGLSNVVSVAAGGNHTLALRADGSVAGWGQNTDAGGNFVGESNPPLGLSNVVAVAAGDYHSLAVLSNGQVVAWGDNSQGQCAVPAGLTNVVAVAGGGAHSLALRMDGILVAWGADWNGQCNLPSNVANVVGLAAGEEHSVALLAGTVPTPVLLNPTLQQGQFTALAQTLNRTTYAFDYNPTEATANWIPLSTKAGNGALIILRDARPPASQKFYRMRQW